MGLIVPSILQLAKSFTDTHFANVSDTGEDIPGFDNMSLWFPSFVFYLLHAMARSVSCAVLFLHFPHYASVMFVPQVIANMIIERYICGQKAIINNIRDQSSFLFCELQSHICTKDLKQQSFKLNKNCTS